MFLYYFFCAVFLNFLFQIVKYLINCYKLCLKYFILVFFKCFQSFRAHGRIQEGGTRSKCHPRWKKIILKKNLVGRSYIKYYIILPIKFPDIHVGSTLVRATEFYMS